jgi:hypothetical protein
MRCLYCDKKLSLLKLAKGDSFCTPEHFDAYQLQMSKNDIARLMGLSVGDTPRAPLILTPREEPPPARIEEPVRPVLVPDRLAPELLSVEPPYAAFAKPLLPAYPPAPESPMAEEPAANVSAADPSFPVHDLEVTAGVLNLYLQTSVSDMTPAEWEPPREPVAVPEELRPEVTQPVSEPAPVAQQAVTVTEAIPRLPYLAASLFEERPGTASLFECPVPDSDIHSDIQRPAFSRGEVAGKPSFRKEWHAASGLIGLTPAALDISHRGTEPNGFHPSEFPLVREAGRIQGTPETRSLGTASYAAGALETAPLGREAAFVNPPAGPVELASRPVLAAVTGRAPLSATAWKNQAGALSLEVSIAGWTEQQAFALEALPGAAQLINPALEKAPTPSLADAPYRPIGWMGADSAPPAGSGPFAQVDLPSVGSVNLPGITDAPSAGTKIGLGAPSVAWEIRVPVSQDGPAVKYLPARRGPILPSATSWPRLGSLPR